MAGPVNGFEDFLPMVQGDTSAAAFLAQMVQILHLWDDLVDRDAPISDETVHRGFYAALVLLPQNEFYKEHFDHLNPILVNAITNWRIANLMERHGDEYQHRIAYILRSSYVDLVTQCALLVGGPDYASEVGYAIRMHAHKETWEGYQRNLAAEFAARNDIKE